MSDPQQAYSLTDDETNMLVAMADRQDVQGIKDYFKSMPTDRDEALFDALVNLLVIADVMKKS